MIHFSDLHFKPTAQARETINSNKVSSKNLPVRFSALHVLNAGSNKPRFQEMMGKIQVLNPGLLYYTSEGKALIYTGRFVTEADTSIMEILARYSEKIGLHFDYTLESGLMKYPVQFVMDILNGNALDKHPSKQHKIEVEVQQTRSLWKLINKVWQTHYKIRV